MLAGATFAHSGHAGDSRRLLAATWPRFDGGQFFGAWQAALLKTALEYRYPLTCELEPTALYEGFTGHIDLCAYVLNDPVINAFGAQVSLNCLVHRRARRERRGRQSGRRALSARSGGCVCARSQGPWRRSTYSAWRATNAVRERPARRFRAWTIQSVVDEEYARLRPAAGPVAPECDPGREPWRKKLCRNPDCPHRAKPKGDGLLPLLHESVKRAMVPDK